MNVIRFQQTLRLNATTPTPVSGFGHIPIWTTDLSIFAGEIVATPRGLVAIHRDATGQETGRGWTVGGMTLRCFTDPGSRLGLVSSPACDTTRRIVIASGPLPLVALAALEQRTDTTYCTSGGVWTKPAGAAAERLIRDWRPESVVVATHANLAVSCLTDFGRRLRDIEVHLEVRPPPRGDWMAALQRNRSEHVAAP